LQLLEDSFNGVLDGGVVLEALVDELDAGHDGGVIAGEDLGDFHVGQVELAAAEVHGDLAGCGVLLGLRFALEVGKVDVEVGGDGL